MIPALPQALLPRRAALALCLLLTSFPCFAGDVTGVALDGKTGAYLPAVTITAEGTAFSAVSDREGRFRLTGLPAGTYALAADSLGYDKASATVSVPASGEVAITLRLGSEITRLAAFTVEGFREGRAKALQQKRTGDNVVDIISADSIGNLPDRNVAEAVGRAAGVNLSLEQGEGRYVSIRGVEPNLNQVTLDGATLAAPGGTRLGRAVPLDSLGTAQIAQIEVVKSVTADMDANSLGGTLNLRTASPFDRKGSLFSGSLSGSRNETTGRTDVDAQLSYSTQFGPGEKWGLAAGVSYDRRHYSNEWLQSSGWSLRTVGTTTTYLPTGLEIKPEWGERSRSGGNLNLEYRPDARTRFYLRPTFSRTSRKERLIEIIHSVDNSAARTTLTTPTSGTFAGAGVRTERRDFASLRNQDLLSVAGGFKTEWAGFTIEPMATFSAAKEHNPYTKVLAFRNSTGNTGPVGFDLGSFAFSRWDVDPAIDLPARYALRRTRDDWGTVDEKTFTGKTDVTWDARGLLNQSGFLKSGVKYLYRDRFVDLESRRLVPVGSWNVGQIGVDPAIRVYGGRFDSGFLLAPEKTWNFIASNPALAVADPVESAQNSIEDDYAIKEHIYAAYTMANVRVSRLTLLGGLRWEKTDATIRAVEARSAGSTLLGRFPTSGRFAYDKLFPNAQAVYRFSPQVLLRAAVTRTIGRPAYEDARPLATFRYDALGSAALSPQYPYSGSVTVGNPRLKPYDALNYDLSLEWYLRNNGILAISAYRKAIKDPIYTYSETQRNVVYSGVSLETLNLTSRRNALDGRISGVEFSLFLPFRFLPSPFDGLGVDANYTPIRSSEVVPTRPGEDIPFFRQPGRIANFTLFYEKGGFSGRVAYTYADRQIYTLGSNLLNDIYRNPRGQYDLLLRYRLSSRYSLTGSIRNVTREPENFSYGVNGLMRTSRLLDRDYKLGVGFNF